MKKLKILAFAGSLRADSINKKLVKWASSKLIAMGHEVTFIDLNDYPLPIYNPDLSAAEFPKNAIALEKLMQEHQAWLIASPEYNYSITSCLKNLIDFVSRAPENKPNVAMFSEKVVGVISASPSNFGGVRGIKHLREILSSMGSILIPAQSNIPNAFSAFDEHGNLIDSMGQKSIETLLEQFTRIAAKLV